MSKSWLRTSEQGEAPTAHKAGCDLGPRCGGGRDRKGCGRATSLHGAARDGGDGRAFTVPASAPLRRAAGERWSVSESEVGWMALESGFTELDQTYGADFGVNPTADIASSAPGK